MKKELIHKGRKLDFYLVEVEMPSGKVVRRELVEQPGAVVILPLLDNGNVVLEDHYRFAIDGNLLEAPAGTLEPGEEPLKAAHRELAEETGLVAREMIELGRFYTRPGVSSEFMYAYLARGLSKGEQNLEDDEALVTLEMPFEDALARAAAGGIPDAKTIATLFLAREFLASEKAKGR
jgi:ADP-ribose pyrophosphatase